MTRRPLLSLVAIVLWLTTSLIPAREEEAPPPAQPSPSGEAAAPSGGAEPPDEGKPEPATTVPVEQSLETLRKLMEVLAPTEEELAKLREQAGAATSEAEKQALERKIQAEQQRIEQLRTNFQQVASGVDDEAGGIGGEPMTLREELEELLRPMLSELREATATPREQEALRRQREQWAERRDRAAAAVERVGKLLELEPGPEIRSELEETIRVWQSRAAEADGEIALIDQEFADREREKRPILTVLSDAFAGFWRRRGVSLLLSLAAFAAVLFIGRRVYQWARRFSPMHRRKGGSLAARAADLAAGITIALIAVSASLGVLYARGDWVLLTLVAVLLFGLVWAARNTLPPYLEQMRVLLNLGPVREGERMVYDGLPWRLDKLGFYTEFSNPALDGGTLRLPVRDLTVLHSRPFEPKEPWFPTRDGDWVVLADETFGRVVHQTPEQVVVLRLGGSRKTYPTAAFLEQTPENLSRGFRVAVVFGIDYQHQPVATTEVPEIFHDRLLEVLTHAVGREGLRSLKVEFREAGSSSLDYAVLADFDGGVAARYNVLQRMIPRVCVDVCNEQGWVIPFTQITLHQAAVAGAGAGTGEEEDGGEDEVAAGRGGPAVP